MEKVHEAPVAALLHAARTGNIHTMNECLHIFNMDANACQGDGWTALHYAIQYGQMGVFLLLVELNAINLNAPTLCGTTPLALALSRSSFAMAERLLDVGSSKSAIPRRDFHRLLLMRGLTFSLRHKLSSDWSPVWTPALHRRFPLVQRQVCHLLFCANSPRRRKGRGIFFLAPLVSALFQRTAPPCSWRYLPPPLFQLVLEFYFWID
ncbi:Aste57867_18080 [Aphanomyces stellatus]|uniref:Aste57867_18080 protein n=1 Tax=Aphanomyces stellatus TaxID=120398 RepID=A0A485L9I1_9STRA|nr:hypothetical protein As57867_018018 [Aphanomyces stellatus]VFT94819.1 Aste57867_18080 [Aphanomyces stellatus]